MTGLETAGIIVAIVFMGLFMLTFLVVLIVALRVLRRVNRVVDSAQAKVDIVKEIPLIGKKVFRAAKKK